MHPRFGMGSGEFAACRRLLDVLQGSGRFSYDGKRILEMLVVWYDTTCPN